MQTPSTSIEYKKFQFTPLREGRRESGDCKNHVRYFNSRPSARGDFKFRKEKNNEHISIHAPPRGATRRGAAQPSASKNFNSRPSARGDIACTSGLVFPHLFQFTPLREGRPTMADTMPTRFTFQFTPLREGRRSEKFESNSLYISIHAPPRGATLTEYNTVTGLDLFQFTPLREGRRALYGYNVFYQPFQFTPLREGRQAHSVPLSVLQLISIHAPPRGATFPCFIRVRLLIFQFTPLREGRRPAPCKGRLRGSYFNSRPSARGDFCGFPTTFALQISIHAPPRGATPFLFVAVFGLSHFNSRPSARGDLRIGGGSSLSIMISIHAPPRGATDCGNWWCMSPVYFNSRPSARGDFRSILAKSEVRTYFNSRPSARGDHSAAGRCPELLAFQFTPLREGRRIRRW